ncbi:hypothetical protein [Methanogenium cariaci]|uniref:hypothetical protein n=1 Tax=Methanogenium cariaci TaxID=2197 RepID=UPI000784CA8A|nr:hypothetical protein [Methanogenium cariaci]
MHTRPASSLDLFTDSVRLMGDATLCGGVMEFDRNLDPDALEKAAQACLMAHPVLHSRLVRGGNCPAVWEMADVPVPPVRVEECDENYHPPRVTGPPVDPSGPLQFRVRLLRRPSGDVIVINLAHAAADAFGLHTLMSQLLQEYQTPGSISPAQGGESRNVTPSGLRKWIRKQHPSPPDMDVINPMWPDPFGTSSRPSTYHRECVSSPALTAMRSSARTLGGAVSTTGSWQPTFFP